MSSVCARCSPAPSGRSPSSAAAAGPRRRAPICRFAEANALPVGCAFRFQDLFDNRHANYVGDVGIGINPKLAQRIKDADLLLAVGARLGEMTTGGYTLLDPPRPAQRLVHVHAGADELGRVYQADLPINSGMPQFAAALAAMTPVDAARWREWTRARTPTTGMDRAAGEPRPGADVGRRRLAQAPPAGRRDPHQRRRQLHDLGAPLLPHPRFRTQLGADQRRDGLRRAGGVAAKIAAPGPHGGLAFTGDGDFLMNGQELATAVQYGAAVIFIVVNNGMYGTIRMHQEREYPGRVYGTELANPDFAALARAYGAHGETVEETRRLRPRVRARVASGKPALIELRLDPEAITTQTTLDAIRAKALQR